MHQRRNDRVEHRRARKSQLHQCHTAHDLCVALNQRTQWRSRCRRAHGWHRHKAGGNARLRENQRRLDPIAVLGQRSDRADVGADGRAPAPYVCAARDRRRHLDGVRGELGGHRHPAPDVLQCVGQPGVTLVQRRCRTIILCADGRPKKADQRQGIAHLCHQCDVPFARGAHLPRLQVNHVHAGAVGAQVGATAIQQQVKALLPPTQDEGAWCGGHGLLHQGWRKAYDLVTHVHPGAVIR